MKIDRNNYEIWIIDYFDGKLSPAEVAELMLFLEAHPDLKENFDAYQDGCLNGGEQCCFEPKQLLKKSIICRDQAIHEGNYQELMFDAVEGHLDEAGMQRLMVFLGDNPPLMREYRLLGLTRLQPVSIPFPAKESLKRTLVIPLRRRLAIAASVAAVAVLTVVATLMLRGGAEEAGQLAGINAADRAQSHRNADTPVYLPVNIPERQDDRILADDRSPQQKNSPRQDIQKSGSAEPLLAMQSLPKPAQLTAAVPDEHPAYCEGTYTEIMHYISMKQEREQGNEKEDAKNLTQMGRDLAYRANGTADQKRRTDRFTFWDLAEIGIAGYNALSNKDVEYQRKTDGDGRTAFVALGKMEYARK